MKSMVYISSSTATISMITPQDIVDRRPVPVLRRGRPTIYYIFLSCTLFLFLGSFSSLMVQHMPIVERDFRTNAVASMNSAQNTKVYLFTGKMDPVCGPSNSCKVFTIVEVRA
ncbi:hypothetical protein ACB092_04G028800 [Castanea dentata]